MENLFVGVSWRGRISMSFVDIGGLWIPKLIAQNSQKSKHELWPTQSFRFIDEQMQAIVGLEISLSNNAGFVMIER